MSRMSDLMYKAVSVVAAATGRSRDGLQQEFLDDRAAFYNKYEEHLRKLTREEKDALRGGPRTPPPRTDEW